jgi:hypothetical protein
MTPFFAFIHTWHIAGGTERAAALSPSLLVVGKGVKGIVLIHFASARACNAGRSCVPIGGLREEVHRLMPLRPFAG